MFMWSIVSERAFLLDYGKNDLGNLFSSILSLIEFLQFPVLYKQDVRLRLDYEPNAVFMTKSTFLQISIQDDNCFEEFSPSVQAWSFNLNLVQQLKQN